MHKLDYSEEYESKCKMQYTWEVEWKEFSSAIRGSLKNLNQVKGVEAIDMSPTYTKY
jgi:hypothetical protein